MSNKCDRCGSIGKDRRNLWMACFYAMEELDIPFKQCQIQGECLEKVGEEELPSFKIKVPVFANPKGEYNKYDFYCLTVCKRCRAEWLEFIKDWFNSEPLGEDLDTDEQEEKSCGSGIFVRVNGATQEITREEWDRLHPGEEPIIYKPQQPFSI